MSNKLASVSQGLNTMGAAKGYHQWQIPICLEGGHA